MRWMVSIIVLAFAFIQPVVAQQKTGKMLKCVDEKGRTHYYDGTPPPECKGTTTELSTKGVVLKKGESALSPEEQKAKEEEKAREMARTQEEKQKLRDQQRKDKALLDTYANEKEIDQARDRSLQQANLAIKNAEERLNSARTKHDGLRKQADSLAKEKKPVPDLLKGDLESAEKEVKRLEAEIAQKQKETEVIKTRYAADKQRYLELTQKKQ